jgi:uncharacterized protein (DUF1499 family)
MGDRKPVGRGLAMVALALSLGGVALVLAAGPGSRAGLWHFRTGFSMFRWAVYIAIAGAVLGLAALVLGSARALAAAAIVAGLGAAAVPLGLQRLARAVPPIHDITTDTDDPPPFEVVLAARKATGATNTAEYGGAEIAAAQKTAYPEVKPLVLSDPPPRAFERALEAVRAMGWAVVDVDPRRGRIEATDTTRWFAFKDDVVVRVRPEGAGSRVDVRSLSRVGKSDVGTNARRIRGFLQRLQG